MNRQNQVILALCALAIAIGLTQFTQADAITINAVRFLALAGFAALSASLAIGPLAVLWPAAFAPALKIRRYVGIASFILIASHFLLVLATYFNYDLSMTMLNTSLTAATAALIGMLALTATSTDWAIRKMGNNNWKALQRLAYPIYAISLYHFITSSGIIQGTPRPAEAIAIATGIATIVLQIAGFVKKRKQ